MKVRITGICIAFLLFQLLSFYSKLYAININEGVDIKFANTVSVEHNSDVLMNSVRGEHSIIGNEPAYAFNEKFQAFLTFKNDNPVSCCVYIPSNGYVSINVIYSHNENYALSADVEGEFGFGDYKSPFVSAGLGFGYQKDMVFNSSEHESVNCFFSIGYKDDLHLSFDFTPGALGGEGIDNSYIKFDAALGYKDILPIFIRYSFDGYFCKSESPADSFDNVTQDSYMNYLSYLHLQYYSSSYGFSAGYSYSNQEYSRDITNTSTHTEVSSDIIGSYKTKGGGFTFYVNNLNSCTDIFGECHIMTDSDFDWMVISKFGVRVYF